MDANRTTAAHRFGIVAESLRPSVFGFLTDGLGYFLAMLVTMAVVPLKLEGGIRQVVTIPWPMFAWTPPTAAFVLLLIVAFTRRSQPQRLAFLIAGATALAFFAYHGVALLRRDFIGKF